MCLPGCTNPQCWGEKERRVLKQRETEIRKAIEEERIERGKSGLDDRRLELLFVNSAPGEIPPEAYKASAALNTWEYEICDDSEYSTEDGDRDANPALVVHGPDLGEEVWVWKIGRKESFLREKKKGKKGKEVSGVSGQVSGEAEAPEVGVTPPEESPARPKPWTLDNLHAACHEIEESGCPPETAVGDREGNPLLGVTEAADSIVLHIEEQQLPFIPVGKELE